MIRAPASVILAESSLIPGGARIAEARFARAEGIGLPEASIPRTRQGEPPQAVVAGVPGREAVASGRAELERRFETR